MLLCHARSLLFLPANNMRAAEKARGLGCDMVILDLEDAIADGDKQAGRDALKAALEQGFGHRITGVRVNGAGSPHQREDLMALRDAAVDYVILPKVEDVQEVDVAYAIAGKPVIAMIETARGVAQAQVIATEKNIAALFMGNNDLRHDLHIPMKADRGGLMFAMQSVVFAARLNNKAVFDGVYNRLDDQSGFRKECEEGWSIGFDGKTVIHPNQIAVANDVFGPSEEELADARALVAAATGGAQRHRGQMIEDMHVDQANMLIARAAAQTDAG